MSVLRPRRLAHRGVVDASALFVTSALIGELRAKERVVRLAATADVHRVLGGWIRVRLRAPMSVACIGAPGVPLVAVKGRVLSGAPLDEDEIDALVGSAANEAFVLVRGGVAEAVPPLEACDPSAWLDLDGYAIAEVDPLGVLPAAPTALLAPARSAREVLGAARPSEDLQAMVAALQEHAMRRAGLGRPGARPGADDDPGRLEEGGHPGMGGGGGVLGILGALLMVLGALGAALFGGAKQAAHGGDGGRVRGGGRASGGSEEKSDTLATLPQEPRGPSWIDELRSRMLDAVARLLVRIRLASFFERKHAEYLSRMLQLFDEGDLDEALRWAIPLGDGMADDPADPAFLPPTPRHALDINLFGGRARSALGLEGDLFDHLRKRYRAAFEKLSAAGRHKDAAFVLVELLGATEEAVSYLERNDLFVLAAELAEARKLAPGLVIRQWMLAGHRARAIAIARRTGAFADAVVRLEAAHKDRATELRLAWADMLAEAGAYAAAIDVVWSLPEAHRLARAWMDCAVDVGGPVGAKMLARKAKIDPGAYADVRDRALALLDDATFDGPAMRLAFGQELAVAPFSVETRVIGRPTVRALLRDGVGSPPGGVVDQLVAMTGDAVLRADLAAAAPGPGPLPERPATGLIARSRADRGAIVVSDAALLPGGRVLVALGEGGTRVIGPDGRMVARFLEPAHSLVISDHGDRALALAPRGKGVFRIARIDLRSRRVEPWCDTRFDTYAGTFDGATSMVGHEGTLHAIDVLDVGWGYVWSSSELGTSIRAIARDEVALSVVRTTRRTKHQIWTYDLPSGVLRQRHSLDVADIEIIELGIPSPSGVLGVLRRSTTTRLEIYENGIWRQVHDRSHASSELRIGPVFRDGLLAIESRSPGTDSSLHFVRSGGEKALSVELEGATKVNVRRSGDRVLVFDDCGRLLLCSLTTRRVLQEWRLA